MPPASANFNSTVFEGHGTQFIKNTRTSFFNDTGPNFTDSGGVLVADGDVFAPGVANSLE